MPSLEFELDQLALANKHVELAQATVERIRTRIHDERLQGLDTVEGDKMLQLTLDSLSAFLEHRDLISKVIDDIRSGRLPST
jgi:hypothetical protein